MAKKKLPSEVMDFFRKQGAKGGKLGGSAGGKKAAASMTPEGTHGPREEGFRRRRCRAEAGVE